METRNRFGAALTDARFVAALAVLVANDHWLKAAWPGWVTGKLSDVAGLMVAAVVSSVLAAAVRLPRPRAVALAAVGAWFAAIKLVPAAAIATEVLLTAVTRQPTRIVVDPTDLLGLVGLVAAWFILQRPRPMFTRRTFRMVAFGAALAACMATSTDSYSSTDLVLDPETDTMWVIGEGIASRVGADEPASNFGVDRTWDDLGAETTACSMTEPGRCFRLEGTSVQESTDGASWRTVWSVDRDNSFVQRSAGFGAGYYPSLATTDIIARPDGTIVVAVDGIDPIIRSIDGTWSPTPLSFRRAGGMLLVIAVFAGSVTVLGGAAAGFSSPAAIWTLAIPLGLGMVTWPLAASSAWPGNMLGVGLAMTVALGCYIFGLIALLRLPNRQQGIAIGLALGVAIISMGPLLVWGSVEQLPYEVALAATAAVLVAGPTAAFLWVRRRLPTQTSRSGGA